GTLVTTEQCLLDRKVQPRNRSITKNELELLFRKYLGVMNTI
ncbi:MAG: agmatine deiminase family protein, partial [Gammaproteobacteria bacterium]|nr:agmatine deiminase family protein [Gammaproteobacteria bacterium]